MALLVDERAFHEGRGGWQWSLKLNRLCLMSWQRYLRRRVVDRTGSVLAADVLVPLLSSYAAGAQVLFVGDSNRQYWWKLICQTRWLL